MDEQDVRRKAAVERLNARRDLRGHVLVYLAVNTLLVVVWAVTGAGYFWPAWPILGWGVGLALQALALLGKKSITEDDIRREMQRH